MTPFALPCRLMWLAQCGFTTKWRREFFPPPNECTKPSPKGKYHPPRPAHMTPNRVHHNSSLIVCFLTTSCTLFVSYRSPATVLEGSVGMLHSWGFRRDVGNLGDAGRTTGGPHLPESKVKARRYSNALYEMTLWTENPDKVEYWEVDIETSTFTSE